MKSIIVTYFCHNNIVKCQLCLCHISALWQVQLSVNHAAGDAPCRFKETNRRRGHRLWPGREWKLLDIRVAAEFTRQLSYRKEDRAMRPIYGCTEKFWESSLRTRLLFQKFAI